MGPKENNSQAYAFYFIAFILVGSFFFLNFFIGVLFLNFKVAQNNIQQGTFYLLINDF